MNNNAKDVWEKIKNGEEEFFYCEYCYSIQPSVLYSGNKCNKCNRVMRKLDVDAFEMRNSEYKNRVLKEAYDTSHEQQEIKRLIEGLREQNDDATLSNIQLLFKGLFIAYHPEFAKSTIEKEKEVFSVVLKNFIDSHLKTFTELEISELVKMAKNSKNDELAYMLYYEGRKFSNADFQYNLGDVYHLGLSNNPILAKDEEKAQEYYRKAYDFGCELAKQHLPEFKEEVKEKKRKIAEAKERLAILKEQKKEQKREQELERIKNYVPPLNNPAVVEGLAKAAEAREARRRHERELEEQRIQEKKRQEELNAPRVNGEYFRADYYNNCDNYMTMCRYCGMYRGGIPKSACTIDCGRVIVHT